ncbi:glutamate 5-kinase [Algoriphagus namhaensis]
MKESRLIVIKIGSNVLTGPEGIPDLDRISKLVSQIVNLQRSGNKIVLISSGAVAFGRQKVTISKKLNPILRKQIWASTGQIPLIREYEKNFAQHQMHCAQILVTKEDFRDRKHFLNMKGCIEALLDQGIVPIINENDTVTITELMFTDNDELAGLTAAMVNAQTLVLLTNVDGIFTGDPSSPDSRLIECVDSHSSSLKEHITATKSAFGRGGMLTKYAMAKKSADLGIEVLIANGKREQVLDLLVGASIPHTRFVPKSLKQGVKKWLAHGRDYYKGKISINSGAVASLTANVIRSLLPVGVTAVEGEFSKGDILLIVDESGAKVGLGKAEYNSQLAQERIGKTKQKALIHYNYLYIFDNE